LRTGITSNFANSDLSRLLKFFGDRFGSNNFKILNQQRNQQSRV
jgi:hypothetical protein